MGKFLRKFRNIGEKTNEKLEKYSEIPQKENINFNNRIRQRSSESISSDIYDGIDDEFDDFGNFYRDLNKLDDYGVGIQPAQKPESFHHFILENKYQDLEKSIRGYKDVYNKTTREWEVKRKETHCFTDEEAEEILRTAQSLLATDIKLSFINKEVFGQRMMMLYKRLKQLFREIAEYRYGRYSHDASGKPTPGGYAKEQSMKLQNLKIFVELTERIVANYSRAIQGIENKLTHQSVSAQESLQSSERLQDKNRRYS
jgi:hypothetical protein